MPLSRIEIEQTAADRWVAEVEVGGLIARRATVRGSSFEEVMIAVEDAYRAFDPAPKSVIPHARSDQESPKVGARHPPPTGNRPLRRD